MHFALGARTPAARRRVLFDLLVSTEVLVQETRDRDHSDNHQEGTNHLAHRGIVASWGRDAKGLLSGAVILIAGGDTFDPQLPICGVRSAVKGSFLAADRRDGAARAEFRRPLTGEVRDAAKPLDYLPSLCSRI